MRRTERQLTDDKAINDIINSQNHCRLGLIDNDCAYIVPLNYGFEVIDSKRVFYFHSASEGKKLDLIKQNNNACIEIEGDCSIKTGDTACSYSMYYQSVIGNGHVFMIDDVSDKRHGLDVIMRQATQKDGWTFSDSSVEKIAIYKLVLSNCTAKVRMK